MFKSRSTSWTSLPITSPTRVNQSSSLIVRCRNFCYGLNRSLTSRLGNKAKLFKYLIVIVVLGSLLSIWSSWNSSNKRKYEHVKSVYEGKDKITIVMNTFKRNDLMEGARFIFNAIAYYSACEIVKHIYVIWSENPTLPQWIQDKYHHENNYLNDRVLKVKFLPQSTTSLNNRFRPIDETTYSHTDAIFSTDDDMRVQCVDLEHAYSIWKGSSRSIIGFMPRIHLRDNEGKYHYRCWWRVWWHGVYSIILTKAALFHHDFLYQYTYIMPSSIRTLVDTERNCEDIAMQFLISNITKLPPIYLKGHLQDLGALNGISTSQNVVTAQHMDHRSKCVNDLINIYGVDPLVLSHTFIDAADNRWTNRPSTWFEYISSDLWKF